MKVMAKGKFEYWLTDDGLLLLEGWARDGLTNEEIAGKIGIRAGTLYEWLKTYPEISESLKKGKEVVDRKVENVLLQKALDGDTTSIIFWLKNRKPKEWRDRINQEISGPGGAPVTVTNPPADLSHLSPDVLLEMTKIAFADNFAGNGGG